MGKHLTQSDRIKMETMLNSGHTPEEVAKYLEYTEQPFGEKEKGEPIHTEIATTQKRYATAVI